MDEPRMMFHDLDKMRIRLTILREWLCLLGENARYRALLIEGDDPMSDGTPSDYWVNMAQTVEQADMEIAAMLRLLELIRRRQGAAIISPS